MTYLFAREVSAVGTCLAGPADDGLRSPSTPRRTPVAPTPEVSAATSTDHIQIRSNDMQSLHAELARSHAAHRIDEAQRAERRHRLVLAVRAQRRAEAAAARARRLQALSDMG